MRRWKNMETTLECSLDTEHHSWGSTMNPAVREAK